MSTTKRPSHSHIVLKRIVVSQQTKVFGTPHQQKQNMLSARLLGSEAERHSHYP
ncbi:MAG TPA: hypothetical protein VKR83_11355 [Ktedonobacteraceae bacterium]|nr:hypothetical protein [Ktedonobacteraceae bacterium]